MKPIGVFYATREGQTETIAEYIATKLGARSFKVDTKDLNGVTTIDLTQYAAIILAASVHAGRHESEMVGFVKRHLAELERLPTAFLSVTLSEAGAERADAAPEDRARFAADVQKVIDQFLHETGWHPQRIRPVAGALLYSKYNFIVRFIMKRIARQAGAPTDASHDYEYTDWAALDHFVGEFADEVSSLPS